MRLLEGATRLEGRVEICDNGEWGTVCDNGWGKSDAVVVCRQLGFSVAGKIIKCLWLFYHEYTSLLFSYNSNFECPVWPRDWHNSSE